MGKHSGSHESSWVRVVRPIFWWLLLALVLFGIRTHERLMKQTRLNFTVTLAGEPLLAAATLDQESFQSGQNISLGEHRFVIGTYKTETFSTNFFAWYGPHDFGEIKLKRSAGILNVQANPPASTITITGPEFSIILSNSVGMNMTVPTDSYTVSAQYPHSSQTQNIAVYDNQSAPCNFAPQLGALHLTCNKDGATYLLQSADQTFTGNLPAILADLPVENYQLTVAYHRRRINETVTIEAGDTNELPVQFVLGTARIESSPPGASVVTANGNYLGQTPLDLFDVPSQTADFNLSLPGYEPVSVTLEVLADQTNVCATNLLSARYRPAMREAHLFMDTSNYQEVVQATRVALEAKPGDEDALALQVEASIPLNAERQQADAVNQKLERLKRPRIVFDSICSKNPDTELFAEHELMTSMPAKNAVAAIKTALQVAPMGFDIQHDELLEPDIYLITAKQTFSLGILGGTERMCLLVVGQASDNRTQIIFKVLEFQVRHNIVNFQDQKQLTPLDASRMQMNEMNQLHIHEGVRIVTERIRGAINSIPQ